MKLFNWLQNLYLKISAKHLGEMQRIEQSIKFQITDLTNIQQDITSIQVKLDKMQEILERLEK